MGADRTFVDVLREMNGNQIQELTSAFAGLVGAVKETGKAGKLQLTVSVKPFGKGQGEATTLVVDPTIKVTKPSSPVEHTIFFPGADNTLQRNDPRQPELSGLKTADVRNIREVRANGE